MDLNEKRNGEDLVPPLLLVYPAGDRDFAPPTSLNSTSFSAIRGIEV